MQQRIQYIVKFENPIMLLIFARSAAT